MSRILFLSALLLASFSAEALRLPNVSPELVAKQVSSHHAQDFPDWNAMDWELLTKVVATSEKRLEEAGVDVSLNPFEHNEAVVKLMQPFVKYLEEHQDNKNNQRLLREVEERIEDKEVTPRWYSIIVSRLLMSLSEITQDEIDFIGQIGYKEFLTVMKKHPPGKLVSAEKIHEIFYDNEGESEKEYFIYLLELPEADKYVELALEKANIQVEPVPVFGTSELDLPTMLTSIFKGIPLAAAPTEKVSRAHGVDMSPGVFALHDILHDEVDPRKFLLKKAIHDVYVRLAKINKKETPQKVLEIATKIGLNRHNLLMKSLEDLHTFLIGKYTIREGIEAYRKIAVALFYGLHEEYNYDEKTFDSSDLVKIVGRILSKEDFEDEVQEEALALFKTDPETGLSPYSDDELIEIALENEVLEPSSPYIAEQPDPASILDRKVERTPQKIIIFVNTKAGSYSFEGGTLKYYWDTLEDEIKLLDYAGIKTERAKLPANVVVADRNGFAIKEVTRIHDLIKKLMDDARERVEKLVQQSLDGGDSLAKKYERAFQYDMMKAVTLVTVGVKNGLNKADLIEIQVPINEHYGPHGSNARKLYVLSDGTYMKRDPGDIKAVKVEVTDETKLPSYAELKEHQQDKEELDYVELTKKGLRFRFKNNPMPPAPTVPEPCVKYVLTDKNNQKWAFVKIPDQRIQIKNPNPPVWKIMAPRSKNWVVMPDFDESMLKKIEWKILGGPPDAVAAAAKGVETMRSLRTCAIVRHHANKTESAESRRAYEDFLAKMAKKYPGVEVQSDDGE